MSQELEEWESQAHTAESIVREGVRHPAAALGLVVTWDMLIISLPPPPDPLLPATDQSTETTRHDH